MTTDSVAEKRRRVHGKLSAYLDSLPECQLHQYSPEEQEEHRAAQRRILDLCAAPEDRRALIEFLIGFTPYVREKMLHVQRHALHEQGQPVELAEAIVCMMACPCAACDLLRRLPQLGPQAAEEGAPPPSPAWLAEVLAGLAPRGDQ